MTVRPPRPLDLDERRIVERDTTVHEGFTQQGRGCLGRAIDTHRPCWNQRKPVLRQENEKRAAFGPRTYMHNNEKTEGPGLPHAWRHESPGASGVLPSKWVRKAPAT